MTETVDVVVTYFANFSDAAVEGETSVDSNPETYDVLREIDYSSSNLDRHHVIKRLCPMHCTEHVCLRFVRDECDRVIQHPVANVSRAANQIE